MSAASAAERTCLGMIALILAAAAMILAPSRALADREGVVTRNGRIGSLTVGVSDEAAVRRFAGRPTQVRADVGEGGVAITTLRYRCGRGCNSVFILDARGRLQNFITRSKRYRTACGTRVGHRQDDAERQEHKAAEAQGCGDFYGIERVGRAYLYVTISETSGRVRALAAAGRHSVLGC
jgi:hypothetical protein